jgi:hypothetical protein
MATANTGITKRIAALATYPFDSLTDSAVSSIIVGQHIGATTFTESDILVRFHTGTTITSGKFRVAVVPDGYDFSDPAAAFVAPPIGGFTPPAGAVEVSSDTTFPFYAVVAGPASGRLVAVVLIATQGSGGDALTAVLSVDLSLKGGAPGYAPWMPNGYRGYRIM